MFVARVCPPEKTRCRWVSFEGQDERSRSLSSPDAIRFVQFRSAPSLVLRLRTSLTTCRPSWQAGALKVQGLRVRSSCCAPDWKNGYNRREPGRVFPPQAMLLPWIAWTWVEEVSMTRRISFALELDASWRPEPPPRNARDIIRPGARPVRVELPAPTSSATNRATNGHRRGHHHIEGQLRGGFLTPGEYSIPCKGGIQPGVRTVLSSRH